MGGGHKSALKDWSCKNKSCRTHSKGDKHYNFAKKHTCFLCGAPEPPNPFRFKDSKEGKERVAEGGAGGGGGGGNGTQQQQGGAAGAGGGGDTAALRKAQDATRKAQAEAKVAKDYAAMLERKVQAKGGKAESPMDIDDGKQCGEQLTEELAEVEADIKYLQEQFKKNPNSASRAAQLESRKAEAATLKQQRWDAECPMQQLRGKSQRILRLTGENEDHMSSLRKVLQTIEEAEDQEVEIRKKMAVNQAEIQRLSEETCKLQIGGEDFSDPKRSEGAWTVIQQKFSQHFDAPTVSDTVQNLRQPLEEAFLTIKAALAQMAQADIQSAAASAAPAAAAAAQMQPDAAATTQAGNALLQQHQQHLAQQHQPLLQQQQVPADASATTGAANALLQQHQQQLQQQQQQQALLQQQRAAGSTTAEQYQVGVAPPQTQAGQPDGALALADLSQAIAIPVQHPAGRKKQAECTDEQIMAMGSSRSSMRAEVDPY